MPGQRDITRFLRQEDGISFGDVFPLVYDELRSIAHHRLARNRPGETVNTTALVHEAYLKLVNQTQLEVNDRAHFFALASRAMRFVLVDYARARQAEKRGGGREDYRLSDVQIAADEGVADILDIDEALNKLSSNSDRLGRIVEYKFFGGLTHEEIAVATGLSVPTIKRDWRRARTWLYHFLSSDAGLS